MNPSKSKSKKKRRPSRPPAPPPPAAAAAGDEELTALNWLADAFASASLDQIASAYRESGGDAYKAAGILGAELVDPGEGPAEGKRGARGRKPRTVAAASGMVSDVIGKGYSKPAAAWCRDRRRGREGKGVVNQRYSAEEAEEFLCSMIGEESELGLGAVRDVLGECGYNVEKALDALLEMLASSYANSRAKVHHDYMEGNVNYSGTCPEIFSNNTRGSILSSTQLGDKTSDLTCHPSEKEQKFLQYEVYDCRDNMQDLIDSKEQSPSRPEIGKSDLQQKVLETLFNIRDSPTYEPKYMDWKKVVEKVESFGQGLEFNMASIAEPHQTPKNGKGDDYVVFRSTARKHWDEMRIFYQRATAAYSRGERAHAAHLSEKGRYYGKLAREADERASREIFEARNKDIKNMVTIDLHGQHVKQAVELLKLHLLLFAYIPSIQFLKVITGCGGAVGVGKGKLKHTVISLLRKEGIEWSEENSGTLVVRIDGSKEYSFMEFSDNE